MSLPRKAKRLVEVLERIAADPASSVNEIAMARTEVERLLSRHGLRAAPVPTPTKRRRRTRLLTAGEAPTEARTTRTRRKAAPTPETAPEAPLRVLPPVAIVEPDQDWAVVLGATLAEALGAQLILNTGLAGVCLSFAGAGRDPELAQAAWRSLHAATKGRSAPWCRGFAASIDDRLDATIAQPAVRARVERVIAWLDDDPMTGDAGPTAVLDVDDDECLLGSDAADAMEWSL